LKMLPRAKIGRLIGYEGDNGHIFKIWYLDTGKIVRSRDVTFWEGNEDSGNISTETKWPTINPSDNSSAKTFTISYYEEPKITKRIQRTIETEIVPPMTVRERSALDQDPENDYNVLDMRSSQYIIGRVETLSPTLQPAAAIEAESAQPPEAPLHPDHPASEKRISAQLNKGKPPERYGDYGEGSTRRKTQAKGGEGTEDLIGLATPTTRVKAWQVKIPDTLKQAKDSPFAEEWLNACQK
jgi:hypothetical protein